MGALKKVLNQVGSCSNLFVLGHLYLQLKKNNIVNITVFTQLTQFLQRLNIVKDKCITNSEILVGS